MDNRKDRLLELSRRLENVELVPGLFLPAPTFSTTRAEDYRSELAGTANPPPSFMKFVEEVGAVSGIDTAGGVAFFTAAQIRSHLTGDYKEQLRLIAGKLAFPFAANGAGTYLVLAEDDTGVWKVSVGTPPGRPPERTATDFDAFVDGLIDDWERVVAGKGPPYSTS